MSVAAEAVMRAFRASDDLYLHADFHQELTQHGRPHVWAKASGQCGRFVGVVQAMESPDGLGFLEGDDQFRVDDQQFAACKVRTTVVAPWNGTGTEDFFNSGWYFGGPLVSAPLHACLVKSDLGQIDAFRFLVGDAPTFQSTLDGQIEQGAENDFRDGTYYSSVAFWYGSGERTPVDAMPAASSLAIPFSPSPRLVLVGPGVIEGESLVRTAVASGGRVDAQGMAAFDGAWSRGSQLFWQQPHVGDTLNMPLYIHKPGDYEIVAYLTRANDYGIFTFSVGGQTLPVKFDAYGPRVTNSGPVSLGTVTLPAGHVPLIVTVAGANPASHAMNFGLDALIIK